MPEEGFPHARTFMAWPAETSSWGPDLAAVRCDVVRIVRAIAEFEEVVLVAGPGDVAAACRACGGAAVVIPVPVDDLWMRDSGPTFVLTGAGVSGVDSNFNGWGGKQACPNDSQLALRLLEFYGIPRVVAPLVTEGGGLEVDGRGLLVASESSIVNDNRNPGRTRAELEADLKVVLGVSEVIWFPGVRGADIADGHIDGLVRCAGPGFVALGKPGAQASPGELARYRQARRILAMAGFEIVDLVEPDKAAIGPRGKNFFGSYVNYYVVNGAVIAPAFGDRVADRSAAEVLRRLYPGRAIVQLRIDALAEGGGGIHRAAQQQPVS